MTGKLAAAILAATITGTGAVGAMAHEVTEGIRYGDGARNALDLYMPDEVENPPLVMFIHGGRWMRNDRTQVLLHDRAQALNDAGIAVASIDYSYSTDATWPAQSDDVLRAMRFLRDSAGDYGYDADRFAVWGQSSGAHMALWAEVLASRHDDIELDAVVSWYAPSNLPLIAADRQDDGIDRSGMDMSGTTPEAMLLGVEPAEDRQAGDAASPQVQLAALPADVELPPMLIMHGTQDVIVSPLQSRRLYGSLLARDPASDLTFIEVEGASHGGDLFGETVPLVVEFLSDRLR
ncbi:alpha/beta hydrolase [Paracoccus sp. PARArs4]|uniref:alpha/beta hydrolase n=1 Tax=Paracoccus sp. PARArs4 TaxID=2853442 RepID=UPI0024A77754|nr:alpha/beta hydrolase [Paracoccus sp. PARArs4]